MDPHWLKKMNKGQLIGFIEQLIHERTEFRKVFDALQAESISREEEE